MKQPSAPLAPELQPVRTDTRAILAGIRAAFEARSPLADPIETLRGLAVLMLLSFHVIGANPGAGLEVDYPHPLRVFADLLIDLRMPLFAFIAGYVYGLRPVQAGHYWSFLLGKSRRLAIPGGIAVLVFVLIANAGGSDDFAVPFKDFWRVFVFSYAHFWFLQAILVIFAVHGAVEILTGYRATVLLLAVSSAVLVVVPYVSPNVFSVSQATQLLPFFLLGLTFLRHRDWMARHSRVLILVCLVAITVGTIWNLVQFATQDELSQNRRDLQSLGVGLGVCLLSILTMPRIKILSWFGPPSFTIYLYHVLGTASTREALHVLGVTSIPVHFVLGIAGGLLLPMALYLLACQSRSLRGPILGLWRSPTRQHLAPRCIQN